MSTPTTTPPPTTPPTGTGTGLRAEFFNNRDPNAPLILNRIDATVDVDWGSNSPAAGVNNDNFSARWTGQVEAPVTGSYVFSTITDDGVRLWINGVQVINDWNGHPPKTNNSPSVALTADQKYDIRMEYFEGSGGAVARLRWSHPGQSQEVVPKERLYPAAAPARLAAAGADEPTFGLADFTIVYPVPAYDEFTFVSNRDVETLRLTDVLGRERLVLSDVRRSQPLSFGSQLPAGHYLLRVQYADGTHRTGKLLKTAR